MRVWVCGYQVYFVHLVRQGHEPPYPAMHSSGQPLGKVQHLLDLSRSRHCCLAVRFFFCHRLRETTPTENEPTAGRSGAPPASLAGICLSEPSKTLIWTEIDYLFYSIVLPNITYGLPVYGASDAEINVLQQFSDRCYKLRFISTQLNIRSLLQKQDKAILQKAKQHDNHPLKVCLPEEKNNLTYNL